jgi:hypothetical protein
MESALNQQSLAIPPLRKILCRFVFAFIFVFLLYYQYSNILVHQLQSPVLIFPYVDLTYWLFHILNIPSIITGNYLLSCCFDCALFASCILSFLFPQKRILVTLFFLLFFIYFIIYNSFGNFHTHSKVGILLMTLPFMFPPNKMFLFIWEAMRYFALFIYADAFLWKLFRAHFFEKDHGAHIIKKNFVAYMYYHPQGSFTHIYAWLLAHPGLIHGIFLTGFILEGLFLVGFFTKRYDKILLVISILLPVGFLFLSNAFFFELLILSFTLIDLRLLTSGKVASI